MPTIQVTFDVPDTLSAEQVQQIIARVNTFVQAEAQFSPESSVTPHLEIPDVDDTYFPAPDANGLYDPTVFAGRGQGRAGAIGLDVEAYLRDLRSDWDERDER